MSWILSVVIAPLGLFLLLYVVAGFGSAMNYLLDARTEQHIGTTITVILTLVSICVFWFVITLLTHRFING
jgi:hypothetical protein